MATEKKQIPSATVDVSDDKDAKKHKKQASDSKKEEKKAADEVKKTTAPAAGTSAARKTGAGTAKKAKSAGSSEKSTGTGKKTGKLNETGTQQAGENPAAKQKKQPTTETEKPTPEPSAPLPVPTPKAAFGKTSEAMPAVEFPPTIEAEKRSFAGRVVFLLCVVAVLLCSYFIFLHRPVSHTGHATGVTFFETTDGRTVIAVNGTVREEAVGALRDCQYDARGAVCVALIGNDLYLVKNRSVAKLTDGVKDFVLASGGGAVAYRDSADTLYYTVIGSREPPAKFSLVHDGRYCLSPNGKELAYTWDHSGTPRMRVYSTSGHEVHIEQDKNLYPLALSDKSTYLYYTDATGGLYLQTGSTVTTLSDSFRPQTLTFNDRLDEVLFTTAEGKTIWIKKGAYAELTPTDGDAFSALVTLLPNKQTTERHLPVGRQVVLRTFARNYYLLTNEGGVRLAYLKGNRKTPGHLTPVSAVQSGASVTVTDKAVYFLRMADDGRTELYRTAAGRTTAKHLLWDVISYCPNVDGSRLLYIRDDSALYAARVGLFRTVSKRLCDAVDTTSLAVTADDVFYFFRTDGKLCRSDNGAPLQEVADGVADVAIDGHTVCYLVQDANGARVYSNHRNRRRDTEIARDIALFVP